jgi:hypothetical protein
MYALRLRIDYNCDVRYDLLPVSICVSFVYYLRFSLLLVLSRNSLAVTVRYHWLFVIYVHFSGLPF